MEIAYTIGLLINYTIPISSIFLGMISFYVYKLKKSPLVLSAIKFSSLSTAIFILNFLTYFFYLLPNNTQFDYYNLFVNLFIILILIWPIFYMDWCSKLFKFTIKRLKIYIVLIIINIIFILLDFLPINDNYFFNTYGAIMQKILVIIFLIDCGLQILLSKGRTPLLVKYFCILFTIYSIFLIIIYTYIEYNLLDDAQYISFNNWYIFFAILFLSWNILQTLLQFDFIKTRSIEIDDSIISALAKKYQITKREEEIMRYITKGYTYMEMSNLCNISYNTIKTHVYNLYQKLNVSGKVELINLIHDANIGIN